MDEKIRIFFHSLLKGKNSPKSLQITKDMLFYIQKYSLNVGYLYTIQIHLLMDNKYFVPPKFSLLNFSDFRDKYSYEIDERYDYSYDDFNNRKIVYISDDDRKQSQQCIEDSIPINENYDLVVNEDTAKFLKEIERTNNEIRQLLIYEEKNRIESVKRELFYNILRDKELHEFDVYKYDSVLFGTTLKLELVTFKKFFNSRDEGDIKLEYYKYYIKDGINKLKYHLGKYFEKRERIKYIKILQFYDKKYHLRCAQEKDPYIKKCYQLFIDETCELIKYIKKYSNDNLDSELRDLLHADKLLWNAEIDDFIRFFDPLIKERIITYKGKNSPEIIYMLLIQKIGFIDQNEESVFKEIEIRLRLSQFKQSDYILEGRLDFNDSRTEFAKRFSKLIKYNTPHKCILTLNKVSDRDPIVRELHKIFAIKSQRAPYQLIDENSLITAFKNA